MNRLYIVILLIFSNFINSSPTVAPVFRGLLGNRLFAFCIGKIVSEELGFSLYSPPIFGFPNTYQYQNTTLSSQYLTEKVLGTGDWEMFLDINKIVNNKTKRNIVLEGYFHKYEYLKSYKDKIRNDWLKFDRSLLPIQDPNDIVIHLRTQFWAYSLPFEYYEQALALTTYNRVFICIDEPTDPILKKFAKYNPIIKSSRSINNLWQKMPEEELSKLNLDDFLFIMSFNKIIIAQSTYSWWAAFLSNAKEIYAPFSNDKYQVYGKVDESRYHYIDTTIGYTSIENGGRKRNFIDRYGHAKYCESIGNWEEAERFYLEAAYTNSMRAEPLVYLANHYFTKKNYLLCFLYAQRAASLPYPDKEELLVEKEIYDYHRYDLLARAAYYIGEFEIAKNAALKALQVYPNAVHLITILDAYNNKL